MIPHPINNTSTQTQHQLTQQSQGFSNEHLKTASKKQNYPFFALIKQKTQNQIEKSKKKLQTDYNTFRDSSQSNKNTILKSKAQKGYAVENVLRSIKNLSHFNDISYKSPKKQQTVTSEFTIPFSIQKEDKQNQINSKCKYVECSKVDPILLQISLELDEQHKRHKQSILQQSFAKRYSQLIEMQRQFQCFKTKVKSQMECLQVMIQKGNQEMQLINENNESLMQEIQRIRSENEDKFSIIEKGVQRQRKQWRQQKEELQRTILKKDNQILHINSQTISTLQLQLQEQLQQNISLKHQLLSQTSQINSNNQNLNTIEQKYLQLVTTLQQSLADCQEERNKLGEDFEKVCEQLHLSKQREKLLNKDKIKLQTKIDLNQKDINKITNDLTQVKQNTQNEIYQHKVKYLQQMKEKNSIIEQFEETRQINQGLVDQLTTMKQKASQISFKLLQTEKDLKTQRSFYLEKCQLYQNELSTLRLKYSTTNNNLQQSQSYYNQSLSTCQLSLQQQTQKCQQLSTDLLYYKQFSQQQSQQLQQLKDSNESKSKEVQQTKDSYRQIVVELKSQLQKAKQIISSKNQQINESRKNNHSLRDQIRQLKCNSCTLQNQLCLIKSNLECQKQLRINTERETELKLKQLNSLRQKYNHCVKEKDFITGKLTSQIRVLDEAKHQMKSQLETKQEAISNLKHQISTLLNEIQSKDVQLSSLRQDLHQKTYMIQDLQNINQSSLQELTNAHLTQLKSLATSLQNQIYQKDKITSIHAQELSNYQQKIQQMQKNSHNLQQKLSQLQDLQQKLSQLQSSNQQLTQLNQLLQYKLKTLETLETQTQTKVQSSEEDTSKKLQLPCQKCAELRNQLNREKQNKQESIKKKSCDKKEVQMVQRRYIQIIKEMKSEIMELSLSFKQKSAEQQSLRQMLQKENQELREKLSFL